MRSNKDIIYAYNKIHMNCKINVMYRWINIYMHMCAYMHICMQVDRELYLNLVRETIIYKERMNYFKTRCKAKLPSKC